MEVSRSDAYASSSVWAFPLPHTVLFFFHTFPSSSHHSSFPSISFPLPHTILLFFHIFPSSSHHSSFLPYLSLFLTPFFFPSISFPLPHTILLSFHIFPPFLPTLSTFLLHRFRLLFEKGNEPGIVYTDEAAKAPDLDVAIVIAHHVSKALILVDNDHQLCPTVLSSKDDNYFAPHLRYSLF